MDSQEIRDRYYGGEGASRDAFEELCALYDAIQVLIKAKLFKEAMFSVIIFTYLLTYIR